MARTPLDVEVAKERFRQAAERLGDNALGSLFSKSTRSNPWAMVGAAAMGLLLGRNTRSSRGMQAALPWLLRLLGPFLGRQREA
jgi:hypothetical protein